MSLDAALLSADGMAIAGTVPVNPVMCRELKWEEDPKPRKMAPCGTGLPCCICQCVPQNEQWAMMYFGKYDGTLSEPGCYCINTFGLDVRKISTKQRTVQLASAKVLDAKGNPVVVDGMVTFVGTSAKRATIDVEKPWPDMSYHTAKGTTFLELQAAAVLKQVCSRYPYEAPPGEHSLQTEGDQLARELQQLLQERVAVTGARILSFDLIDLSYAPEIAAVMLVRQQAEAFIDARRLIVQAAVDMTSGALEQLRAKGLQVTEATTQQITSNLLTVICSHQAATPVVSTAAPA